MAEGGGFVVRREEAIVMRCRHCGTPYLELQDGAVVIRSRHHGELHVNVVSLRTLAEMAAAAEEGRHP
jgi:hypothetical protein